MGVKVNSGKIQPSIAEMVTNSLKTLNKRQGSSLAAIKKFMSAAYQVDPAKIAAHIKRFLKSAVEKGTLIQTKGKGASGSFKLSKKQAAHQKTKSNKTPKRSKPKKVRTPARKALFQTPQPGKPKPKARDLAQPIPYKEDI